MAGSGEKALESLELIMVTLGAIIAPNSKLLLKGIKGKISSEGEISDSKVIDEIRVVVGSLLESIDDSTASAEGEGSKCLGGTSAGREA